jgi:serine/threonine-protein kinase
VLYELVAGRTPFERDNTHATLAAVLMGPIERLDAATPGVPAALADAVARALERNRARRFGSARELRDALLEAPLGRAPTDAPAAAPPPHHRPPGRPVRLAAAAVGLALAAAVGASTWGLRARPAAPRPAAVASPRPPEVAPVAAALVAPDAPTPSTPIVRVAAAPGPPRRALGPRPTTAPPPRRPALPEPAAAARVGANGAPIEGL